MSKDYLEDVLDKIAQVTKVLVDTAKIKDLLDKSNDDAGLKIVLEKTKAQVECLTEHSQTIRDFFFNKYEEVYNKLNTVNGVTNETPSTVNGKSNPASQNDPLSSVKTDVDIENGLVKFCKDSASESSSSSSIFNVKPSIKLVDINKLVEPKNTTPKEKKSVQFDTTVVIITSSDDEVRTPKPHTSPRKRLTRTSSARPASKKRVETDSDSDSHVSDSPITRSPAITNNKRKGPIKSSDSSTEDNLDTTQLRNRNSEVEVTSDEEESVDWRNDVKFKSACYVKLLRIPCEKLKEFYLEKLEVDEIERLCDLNFLKRTRGASSDSPVTKKKKLDVPVVEKNSDSDDSTDDNSTKSGQEVPIGGEKDPQQNDEVVGENSAAKLEEAADIALALLNSDDESTDASKSPTKDIESERKDTAEKEIEENNEVTEKSTTNEAEEKVATVENVSTNSVKNRKLLSLRFSSSDSDSEPQITPKKDEDQKDKIDSAEEAAIPKKKKRLVKRRMKKAILSDSESGDDYKKPDTESSSSSDSEKENEKEEPSKTVAKKRIRRVKDSSEDDDEDKSTRKHLRHILGRDRLAETTKQAEDEEKERKARIAEKQRKYNQIYETDAQVNASVEKVVLDFDEKNNKELLKVDPNIVSKLKPHQASGIQFMWDACFESLERARSTKGSGCILAHCMGLGKTLQVIALTHTLLVNSEKTNIRKVMVVSPVNTVLNWVNEYKQWMPDPEEFEVYELVSHKQNSERQYTINTWHKHGGVLIIGYSMFRTLSNPDNKRISKKLRNSFQEGLVDPGPDLVICDEGHLLKNEKTNLSIAMNRLKTMRRIVLTGTPLQNNLKEYFCMVQFIKPNLLGTYKEYLNRFVNPIINGQYTDSTLHDIQIMRKRSHVLHKMLDGVVQRRDYSVLQPYLPPKYEYVLFLNLTETQIQLYDYYMKHFARDSTDGSKRTAFLFVDFQAFQRICTHPRVLLDKSKENKKNLLDESGEDSEGSLKDFIDDGEAESDSNSDSSSSSSDDCIVDSNPKKRTTRAARALARENDEEVSNDASYLPKEWWQQFCDNEQLDDIGLSSKLFLLFEILKECEQIGDKILVFSQSLYSLNVIEYFLGRIHDATESGETDKVGGYSGSWCLGLDYFRLDGSSSCDNRTAWCKSFNKPSNTRARLFLISTKAGGLGINLYAANRVIIFDVSWNPSHDIQSIYRVYRFGQTKPSYIYRFVTYGTMEMKMYERQVTKQAISKRVIDEQQIDRHYNQNDLQELYKFDPRPEDRPIPLVPKDVLLGELLQKFDTRIYKYHEHQSLLENKEEEGLNEEERKAAWEEFENEKKQRTNLGATNFMSLQSMTPAMLSLIKKENPGCTDVQAKHLLPVMQMQLQEQVARGDLTMFRRVQQELQVLHAMHNQRLKEQFYQQQIRLMQQQAAAAATMDNNAIRSYLRMAQNPGTSQSNPNMRFLNPTEVIDLNEKD